MRRRLQESFHLSSGGGPGGILSNGGGFMASLTGGGCGSAQSQIPSISVSVQTEPTLLGTSGMMANGGHTLLPNGGGTTIPFGGNSNNNNNIGNGGNRNNINDTSHGNTTAAAIMSTFQHHSATLPHPSALSKLDSVNQLCGNGSGHMGTGSGVTSGINIDRIIN